MMGSIVFIKSLDRHPEVHDASVSIKKDTKFDNVKKDSHIPVFAHSPSMSGTMFLNVGNLIESGYVKYAD